MVTIVGISSGLETMRLTRYENIIFYIQYSVFNIQYSIFNIQYSIFNIQYLIFHIS